MSEKTCVKSLQMHDLTQVIKSFYMYVINITGTLQVRDTSYILTAKKEYSKINT